jgi:Fe-S-cluster containining protein
VVSETLHIPVGIRFDCSGCGNCCLGWPVPVTQADYIRISALDLKKINLDVEPQQLFRALSSNDQRLRNYTHTLEKRPDGRCTFLTEEERCTLHINFGAQSKPSMCSLFPYTFTQTPSGVFASVSFASTGVLLNSGTLLSDQPEALSQQWQLFKSLYPDWRTDWTGLQLLDGASLSWHDYISLEETALHALEMPGADVLQELSRFSGQLIQKLDRGRDPERMPAMEASPGVIDQIILKHLNQLYLERDPLSNSHDLDARALMTEIVQAPQAVTLACASAEVSFAELSAIELGDKLAPDIEDLLRRFVYCRIFGKLYCGPSFGHLSVIAGLHHLHLLVSLLRMKMKLTILQGGTLSLYDVAELIRTVERQLTQLTMSRETSAVMEVLMSSPSRIERVWHLAR